MEYLLKETETDDSNLEGCLFYFAFAIDFVCLMRLMRSVLHLKRFNRTLFVYLQFSPQKFSSLEKFAADALEVMGRFQLKKGTCTWKL